MQYETVVEEFIRLLPDLRTEIERDLQDGPYIVFGMVVRPWLESVLKSGASDPRIREAFTLFERMAESPDLETVNFVWIEVGELLVVWRITEPMMFSRAEPHIGPRLLGFAREISESPLFNQPWS
jgi:hypothetical protein